MISTFQILRLDRIVDSLPSESRRCSLYPIKETKNLCCYSRDMGKSTFQPLFCCQKQGETTLTVLTGHIEVDQPLVLACFVLGGTLVYDGNTGVADVKPAHYLWGGGEKKGGWDFNFRGGNTHITKGERRPLSGNSLWFDAKRIFLCRWHPQKSTKSLRCSWIEQISVFCPLAHEIISSPGY